MIILYNFNDKRVAPAPAFPAGKWRKLLDSAETRWLGKGSVVKQGLNSRGKAAVTLEARSFVLYRREG
ncbi:MAG: hypothetical protein A2137_07245 [Chloroflexi bacterium RBG_16_58_8]|nr:MAG: hypothetical protein A2137_07245 [Chloroflexi bacterium RBG_16_58_8]